MRNTQYSIELSVHKQPSVFNTTYTLQSQVNCLSKKFVFIYANIAEKTKVSILHAVVRESTLQAILLKQIDVKQHNKSKLYVRGQ